MAEKPSISVVVCSIDERKARRIREHYRRLLRGRLAEIVQITDARSLSEGYNRGFRQTSGEIVIFSHDDIEIVSDDFAKRLLIHLETHDVVGVAGTSKLVGPSWITSGSPHIHGIVAHHHPGQGYQIEAYGDPTDRAQALDGVFFAARRAICAAVPFDEETFDGFHYYDLDFTFRSFEAGYRLKVCTDILLVHESGGSFDAKWAEYAARFEKKFHGRVPFEPAARPRWRSFPLKTKAELIGFHRKLSGAAGA